VTQLFKLRGSVDQPETLVLTEEEFRKFLKQQESISTALKGQLASKMLLFLGYDLEDPDFRRLYEEVIGDLDKLAQPAYALFEADPPLPIIHWCLRHGVIIIKADPTAFLKLFAAQWAKYARAAEPAPPESPAPTPDQPYKLLDYYEPKDAPIFFGRQRETESLSALIKAHRVVVLHGASGVGKTSLLLAGATPLLERADPPFTLVYARALEDPAQAIRKAIHRKLDQPGLPTGGTLADFLAAAIRALPGSLLIVLDQFEEFFIRLSARFREAFIAELGEVYNATDLPVSDGAGICATGQGQAASALL
jgi:hypothetical protein